MLLIENKYNVNKSRVLIKVKLNRKSKPFLNNCRLEL